MRFFTRTALLLVFTTEFTVAQGLGNGVSDRTPQIRSTAGNFLSRLAGPYRAKEVSPVNFQNSSRIFDLIRAGQLYLSLEDAIALALENNLDIELERFLPKIADTDLLRARGGGLLRGLSLLVNEAPPGIGGPNGPLLTNLTAGSTPTPLVNTNFSDIALISQQQNNLSVTGAIPLSNGPVIPQYDPILSGLVTGQHLSTPEFSPALVGSNWLAQNGVNATAGLNVGFSPGTQLGVTFDNSLASTNATRYTYNPFVTSSLGFTITQPLLQGFGASLNKRYIRIARNSQRVADLVFRQQVMDTVAGIARLYTDLVSLNEDVKVKQEAVLLAERLSEDNRNKVEQGTQAPIELTRANAALAASRQGLITAEGLVRQQELIVKTAITRGGLANPQLLTSRVIPTDPLPVPDQEPEQALPNLLGQALEKRPDLAGAGIQVENSEISLKGSLNALKPQVNLVGIVQNGGLAGDLNPLAGTPIGSVNPGGYGTALGQVFRRDFPSYSIGVQLALPVRNRVAQADAVRDELEVRQTQVRRQQLEDQVRLEVADADESLRQARAAYEASVEARRLQEQSVVVADQTFAVGLSTNLVVIQYQNFLAQARSTEVASKGAYLKAKIALQRATGTVLDENHVGIDEAYRGNVTRPPSAIPPATK
ncbi:MAG: outer rane efflux protein [Bryobacterales bacterium]|nr:outer rane efflux protein [Bryobacterales bacterium]